MQKPIAASPDANALLPLQEQMPGMPEGYKN
jgi:hypothetical protein